MEPITFLVYEMTLQLSFLARANSFVFFCYKFIFSTKGVPEIIVRVSTYCIFEGKRRKKGIVQTAIGTGGDMTRKCGLRLHISSQG